MCDSFQNIEHKNFAVYIPPLLYYHLYQFTARLFYSRDSQRLIGELHGKKAQTQTQSRQQKKTHTLENPAQEELIFQVIFDVFLWCACARRDSLSAGAHPLSVNEAFHRHV
jgi:hypothetical protein